MWERLGGLSTWGPRHEAFLRGGVRALLPLAIVEAVLGRGVTPATPAWALAATVLLPGLVAALATAVLVLILWALRVRVLSLPVATDAVGVLTIGFVGFAAASWALTDPRTDLLARTLFLAAALVILAEVVAPERGPWVRALSGLLALCYAASWVGALPGSEAGPWARIAEASAVLVPLPLFAVARVGRTHRELRVAAVAWASAVGAYGLAVFAWPAEAGAVALHGFGFSLFLPQPLNAAALGLAVASFLLLVPQDPATRRRAYGIGLVFAAGIDLHPPHVQVIALVGLLLWAVRERRPEPVPAAAPSPAPAPVPAKAAE